jgi:V-type H+-transporting ATPase subunit C
MAEKYFWLISAPKTPQDTFATVNRRTAKEHNLSTNYKFEIPDLKVGTLDSLMALSDDLSKIDTFVEQTTKKIVRQLMDINDKKTEKGENLTVNGTAIETYLTHFTWDEAKYPVRSPLKELTDKIQSQVAKLDEELKVKAADYANISHTIAAEERKLGGNLLVRSLVDIVKGSDLTETDYLTTLLVVVPKYLYKDWHANYETLTNFVLPRSTKMLAEDSEYGLFTATLFKRVVEDFKNIAREKRFTVRDFRVDEEGKSGKEERNKLITEKDRQKRNLIRWCKTNFAEGFVAWMHLKAVRVFVESVLRYGLPVNFQAILMHPYKKDDKRLRDILYEMFKHLAAVHVVSAKDDDQEKFYPYVYIPIDLTDMA